MVEERHCYQLRTSYGILTRHMRAITGDQLYGFRNNWSIIGRLFCNRQTPEKTWEDNRTVKGTN